MFDRSIYDECESWGVTQCYDGQSTTAADGAIMVLRLKVHLLYI